MKMKFQMRLIIGVVFLLCIGLSFAKPKTFEFKTDLKKDPAKVQLELGKQALDDKMYDAARRYFTKFMELNGTREPDYGEGTLLIANTWLLKKHPQMALNAIEEHAKKSPGLQDKELQWELEMTRAQAYAMNQQWSLAHEVTSGLLKENPTEPLLRKLLLLHADIARGQGDWQAVIETLKSCSLTDNNAFPVVERLARAYTRLEQYEKSQEILNGFKVSIGTDDAMTASLLRIPNLVKMDELKQAKNLFISLQLKKEEHKAGDDLWYATKLLAEGFEDGKKYDDANLFYGYAYEVAPNSEAKCYAVTRNMKINLLETHTDIAKAREILDKFSNEKEYSESALRWKLTVEFGEVLYNEAVKAEAAADKEAYLKEAVEYFKKVIDNRKNSPSLKYKACIDLGECSLLLKKYDEACEAFENADAAAADYDEHAYALIRVSDTMVVAYHSEKNGDKKGEYDKYAERALKALENVKINYFQSKYAGPALYRQACLLAEMDNFLAATVAYKEYAEKYARKYAALSEDEKRRVQGIDFDGAELLQGRCQRRAAEQQVECAAALEFLKALAGRCGEDRKDEVLLEVARCAWKAGENQQAEDALKIVLENKGVYAESALFLRCCMRFDMEENLEAARKDASEYISSYPQKGESCDKLRMLLGDSYSNEKRWQEAIKCYEPIAKNSSYYTEAQYEIIFANYKLKQYAEALGESAEKEGEKSATSLGIDGLKGILSKQRSNDMLYAKVLYLEGDICSECNDYERAEEAYGAAAERAGENMLRYSAFGRQGDMLMVLAVRGKSSETEKSDKFLRAENCFKKIIARAGEYSYAPIVQMAEYNLGVCWKRQGKKDEAIEQFREIYGRYNTNFMDYQGNKQPAVQLDEYYVLNALKELIPLLKEKNEPYEAYEKYLNEHTALFKPKAD